MRKDEGISFCRIVCTLLVISYLIGVIPEVICQKEIKMTDLS